MILIATVITVTVLTFVIGTLLFFKDDGHRGIGY